MGDPWGFVNGFGIRGLTIFGGLAIFGGYGASNSGFWEEKYGLEKTGYQGLSVEKQQRNTLQNNRLDSNSYIRHFLENFVFINK